MADDRVSLPGVTVESHALGTVIAAGLAELSAT